MPLAQPTQTFGLIAEGFLHPGLPVDLTLDALRTTRHCVGIRDHEGCVDPTDFGKQGMEGRRGGR